MKIGKQFNKLTKKEYKFYIDNHKKYTDFNTLGLYRSLVENKKLTTTDKIEIRDYAHQLFRKSFDFLQLKDPDTFFKVSYLGQDLTKGDEINIWEEIKINQQKILSDKKIKHRNFGIYSKHECGYDDCVYKGLMIKPGSWLTEHEMHFDSDENRYMKSEKSKHRKSNRKKGHQIINDDFEPDQ